MAAPVSDEMRARIQTAGFCDRAALPFKVPDGCVVMDDGDSYWFRGPPGYRGIVISNKRKPRKIQRDVADWWLHGALIAEGPAIEFPAPPSPLAPIPATTGAPAVLGLPALPARSDDEVM